MHDEFPPNELPPNERPSGQRGIGVDGFPAAAALVPGLILIAVGGIFLLRNLGLLSGWVLPHNWWALFFLIPMAGVTARLWQRFQANGYAFDGSMTGEVTGLLILTVLLIVFLFGYSFGRIWPVFLIIAGLGALIRAAVR